MAASSLHREVGEYIIDKDDRKCLGRTQRVSVYPGKHKNDDNIKVAGKMFLWTKGYSAKEVDDEIELMKSIPPHENVLKLLDNGIVDVGNFQELWLILEHCKLGHLGDFVHTRPLSLAQRVDLMLQSAKGVHHLHHMPKPLIHRDIKPANLLVTGTPGQPVVKVADFGESRYFEGSKEESVRNMTFGGTPYYQAPELFSDKKTYRPKQNKAVDIFALGMSFEYVLEAEVDQIDQTPVTGT
jgi:serine/threonine protein kinase